MESTKTLLWRMLPKRPTLALLVLSLFAISMLVGYAMAFYWADVQPGYSAATYPYSGDLQTYVVPAGITSVSVKMWGAGGGVAESASGKIIAQGGAGGYTSAILAVTPGETLYILVGGTNGGLGGGGDGTQSGETPKGGGFSALYRSNGGVAVVVAGGGGAGGNYPVGGSAATASGAAGGGLVADNTVGSGGPGTQSSGGQGGGCSAEAGGSTQGGDAGSCLGSEYTAGGGGGGWYGGGGGAATTSTGGGGGGGSGYCSGSGVTFCVSVAGSGSTPGNSTDPVRPLSAGTPGQNGIVLISTASAAITASPQNIFSSGSTTISWMSQNTTPPSPLPWIDLGAYFPTKWLKLSQSAVGTDGYVYSFGGWVDGPGATNIIYRAPVGNPLSWATMSARLPSPLSFSELITPGDGYMYLLGGQLNSFAYTNKIFRAPVDNPLSWTDMGARLPVAIAPYGQAAVVGDYIYIFGGSRQSPTNWSRDIYRAPVGNPLSWATTSGRLPDRRSAGLIAIPGDGYIYLFGGQKDFSAKNNIYRAPVSNPLSWVDTGALLPDRISFASLTMPGDGYIYILNGASLYRAPVTNPLQWVLAGTLPSVPSQSNLVTVGGYDYIFSGNTYNIFRSSSIAPPCTVSGNGISESAANGSALIPALAATSTYLLQCNTDIGVITASTTVGILTPVSLQACKTSGTACSSSVSSPVWVDQGSSGLLFWSGTGASSCGLTDSTVPAYTLSTSLVNPGGGLLTEPLTATTTYTLTCQFAGIGERSTAVRFVVNLPPSPPPPPPLPPPPDVTIDLTRVRSGNNSTLSWTITGMATGITCSITPPLPGGLPAWDGIDPWVGSATTSPVGKPTEYTMSCGNTMATTSTAATVKLVPGVQEI